MTIPTPTAYDEVIYLSQPINGTHPNHLASIAHLFGIQPPEVKKCRVLELGCGTGGNIIPQAYSLPEAHFVGIDLSLKQIEYATKERDKHSIRNLELIHKSILEIDKTFGIFDFIICHGIFSWVSNEVRNKILDIFRDNLSPNGLAYLSYNVLPGWHIRTTLRDAMLFHTRDLTDPNSRAQSARQFISFLNQAVHSRNNSYNSAFKEEAQLAINMPDWYLAHDFLAEINQPFYFYQLYELSKAKNLQYLADTEMPMNTTQEFSADVKQILRKISKDMLGYEQYLDYLRNRAFRRSIFCSSQLKFERRIEPDRVAGLRVSADLKCENDSIRPQQGIKLKFIASNGGAITTDEIALQSALFVLKSVFPESLSFSELHNLIYEKLKANDLPTEYDTLLLKQGLLSCFIGDLLSFSFEPVRQLK